MRLLIPFLLLFIGFQASMNLQRVDAQLKTASFSGGSVYIMGFEDDQCIHSKVRTALYNSPEDGDKNSVVVFYLEIEKDAAKQLVFERKYTILYSGFSINQSVVTIDVSGMYLSQIKMQEDNSKYADCRFLSKPTKAEKK